MPRGDARGSRYGAQVVANGFFASASRKKVRKPGDRHKVQSQSWQDDAWGYFDTVGEYHSACNWIANMVSRAKLQVMKDGVPVTDETDPAFMALQALYGGPEEQPEMLRLFGLHLTVAGDCYLIASSHDDDDDDWDIYSNLSVKESGSWYRIEGENEDIPQSSLVMRLWRKHPRDRKKGDSNSRAALPVLSELETLTMRVAADSESRLVGAGLLLLPSEVSFPSRIQTREQADDEAGTITTETVAPIDAIMDLLIEVASLSITDQSNAAAKVPIVMQMPGESISKVRVINFWSEYDEAMKDLRSESIRRLSLAMDMPPEVLTGMADANHWTAWQMEEAAIKVHTEPLLKLIVSSLNEGYLWPYLADEDMDDDEIRRYSLAADTSEMRLRPNRSKEAVELNDRGILKDKVVVRENGFHEDDMMDDTDRRLWIMRKIAQGSPTPEGVLAAVAAIGGDLPTFLRDVQSVAGAGGSGEPREDRPPVSSTDEHPVREIPEPAPDREQVAAAAETLLFRALERAGNRLKNRMGADRPAGVAACDLYKMVPLKETDIDELLEDAWSLAERLEVKVPVDRLNAYARYLLRNAADHDPKRLRTFLVMADYALGAAA